MNFPKNCPFEDCSFWNFSGMAQFSVLTYFHYFGFFGIILSRSMRENSVILNISPFGCTSLSNSCIWSFCHFCPMHNFLLWLIWKIQLFLAILEKSLPENHASVLFCHFGIHSSIYTIRDEIVCSHILQAAAQLPFKIDSLFDLGRITHIHIYYLDMFI